MGLEKAGRCVKKKNKKPPPTLACVRLSAVRSRLKRQVGLSSGREIGAKASGYNVHTMRNVSPYSAALCHCHSLLLSGRRQTSGYGLT